MKRHELKNLSGEKISVEDMASFDIIREYNISKDDIAYILTERRLTSYKYKMRRKRVVDFFDFCSALFGVFAILIPAGVLEAEAGGLLISFINAMVAMLLLGGLSYFNASIAKKLAKKLKVKRYDFE